MTYCTRLSFCFSPGLSIQTLVTAFRPLVVAIGAIFPRCPPSAADALCLACRRPIAKQPRVTLMKTEGAFCVSALPSMLLSLPFQQWPDSPPPPLLLESCQQQTPLDGGRANFVIGNQSVNQLSRLCPDRDSVWTEKGREGEPNRAICVFFLHEGHDREVPGWIPWGLDIFPVAGYRHVCSHRQAHLSRRRRPLNCAAMDWQPVRVYSFLLLPSPATLIGSKRRLREDGQTTVLYACHSKLDPPPWHAYKEQTRVNTQRPQCVGVSAEWRDDFTTDATLTLKTLLGGL